MSPDCDEQYESLMYEELVIRFASSTLSFSSYFGLKLICTCGTFCCYSNYKIFLFNSDIMLFFSFNILTRICTFTCTFGRKFDSLGVFPV